MVGRGDHHCVYVGAGEDFAEVFGHGAVLVVVHGVHDGLGLAHAPAVHVANHQHAGRRQLEVSVEVPAQAVVADANRYFAGAAPWALRKTDPPRMGTVLHATAEVIRQVAILVQPVMPGSAAKLLDLLAVPADARSFVGLGPSGRLQAGTKLPVPEGVFPRYVEDAETGREAVG